MQDSRTSELRAGLENFAFLDKMRDSGPPYNIRTDFLAEIDRLRAEQYSTDLDFQEDLQAIMIRMHDAHTQYVKPMCYHATYVVPFTLRSRLVGSEQRIFAEPATYSKQYEKILNMSLDRFYGREIVAINKLETMTFVGDLAEDLSTESNDLSAAFNQALRDVFYRRLLLFPRPETPSLMVTFGEPGKTEGSVETVEFPWLVFGDDHLGELSACEAHERTLQASLGNEAKGSSDGCRTWLDKEACHYARSVPLVPHGQLTASFSASDIKPVLPDGRPSTISCYTEQRQKGVTLVMKVRSFEPEGMDLNGFIDDALTCLQTPFDFVILDVMQNGGGIVGLGYRLTQILVEKFWREPTRSLYTYDLKHSALMDAYVKATGTRTPWPDSDPSDYVLDPSTLKPFNNSDWYLKPAQRFRGGVLGNYSQKFTMNFGELFAYKADQKPHKFPKPSEIAILSDGTCGSTCATFILVMNEGNLATTVGVGGISQYTMAVSSFAGGTVSNLGMLSRMGELGGLTVPQLITSSAWQFTFFELYSAIYTNTPAQFVMQNPTVRIPWWDFPHPTLLPGVAEKRLKVLYELAMIEVASLNPSVSPVIVV
eukprot:TRINITY_DN9542_c0_g1_i1.p1 TRINITY_DN9542_c0_g1~~TRINITY_DN9542_c0_g1_i1.p1  ORF type:complete len:596 (-),score=80.20 TRINITY_DN9542_c0_g1_i1:188-1975(-)